MTQIFKNFRTQFRYTHQNRVPSNSPTDNCGQCEDLPPDPHLNRIEASRPIIPLLHTTRLELETQG